MEPNQFDLKESPLLNLPLIPHVKDPKTVTAADYNQLVDAVNAIIQGLKKLTVVS